jgi:hypothetical protein
MAQRPNIFDKEAFENFMRQQGCAESMISPNVSDYRLFVPLALRELGVNGIVNTAEKARGELKLGPQREYWVQAAQYAVAWAEAELERYKTQK